MQQAPTIIIILLGISGLLSIYLAAFVQNRSKVQGTGEFFFLLICIAIYSLGYAIELSRNDLQSVMSAIRFEYLGIPYIPTLILLFVIRFIRKKPTSWYIIAPLLLIPVTSTILVFTHDYHNLFYINPRIENAGLFPVFVFERAAWYIVQQIYLSCQVILAIILMTFFVFRSSKRQRFQAVTITIGVFLPLIGYILFVFGVFPGKVDPGPFGVTLTGLLLTVALTKLGLFELVPAARELALDSINDCLIVVDENGLLQDMNKAANMLPGANELKLGHCIPTSNPLFSYLKPLLAEGKDVIEFTSDCPEYGERCYSAKAYKIMTNHTRVNGTAILISDITESAGIMQMLSLQASTDELTGILNRRHLIKLGIHEIDWSRRNKLPLGVIMIDLDHFKLYNDKYGHAAGDEILIEVTKCFHDALRNVDILGRFGGEEFVVFLPGADFNTTAQIAARLKDRLENCKILIGKKTINITASYGIHSCIADSETSIDELLRLADLALYHAKETGRNRVAWSSDLSITTYADSIEQNNWEKLETRKEDRNSVV